MVVVKSCKDFVEGFFFCSTIVATLHRIVGSHLSAEEYSCYWEQYSWYWWIKKEYLITQLTMASNVCHMEPAPFFSNENEIDFQQPEVLQCLPMKFSLNKSYVELQVVFPFSTERRNVPARTVTELFLFAFLMPVFTIGLSLRLWRAVDRPKGKTSIQKNVFFRSLKRVYFFKNANVLNF